MPTISTTSIANMALVALGEGKEIADLETEKSAEARVIRRYYDEALDEALSDYPWPFAGKNALLGTPVTNPDPGRWLFAYRHPADMVAPREIINNALRDPRPEDRIEFINWIDDQGGLILTNQSEACLSYTFRQKDVLRYSSAFRLAFSYQLASLAAISLTQGDPFGVSRRMLDLYLDAIRRAEARAENEQVRGPGPPSSFEDARL